ncbi:hypothetical protein FACS189475_00990 [Betaproteobacteria bacterium]|nr:hypothetical protein FACS189475_00990 [Betaproteobacteria bacterium]
MDALKELSVAPPLSLKGLDFQPMFQWLSVSLVTTVASNPGDKIPLEQTQWAFVSS